MKLTFKLIDNVEKSYYFVRRDFDRFGNINSRRKTMTFDFKQIIKHLKLGYKFSKKYPILSAFLIKKLIIQ